MGQRRFTSWLSCTVAATVLAASLAQPAAADPQPPLSVAAAQDKSAGRPVGGTPVRPPQPEKAQGIPFRGDGLQADPAAPRELGKPVSDAPTAPAGTDVATEGTQDTLQTQSLAVDPQPWRFFGPSTYDLFTPGGPVGRDVPAMTYDAARDRTVVFGGCKASGCATDEMWLFDGAGWSAYTGPRPPARYGATLVYSTATSDSVLFGGYGATGQPLADTWVWNGSSWAQRFPATVPAARALASSAYGTTGGKAVLFGGVGAAGQLLADTWTWNGTTWAAGPAGPPARSKTSLADTGTSQGVLLYGGRGANGLLGDTWTFDGTAWTQHQPAATLTPGALESHAATYSPEVGAAVLGGGFDTTFSYRTWAWTGVEWARVAVALELGYPGVDGIAGAALTQSPKDGLLHFGGKIGDATASRLSEQAYLRTYMPSGHSPYGSRDDQQVTDGVTIGADLASAGLIVRAVDLSLPGVNGLDLELDRYYSTLTGQVSRVLPYSWSYDLLDTAAYRTPGNSYVVSGIDGQQLLFRRSGSGFASPAGSDMTFTNDTATGVQTLKEGRSQRTWRFTSNWLTSITDANGNAIRLTRDANRKVTSITDTKDRVVTFTYNANGRIAQITDPSGRKTMFDYTAGIKVEKVEPSGTVLSTTTYSSPASQTLDISDGAGNVTRAVQGAFNRAKTITRIDNPAAGTGPTRTYDHSDHPRVKVTNPLGRTTTYTASTTGDSSIRRVGKVTDPLGRDISQVFDNRGNLTSTVDALGATATSTFDTLNNPTGTHAPDVPGGGAGSGATATAAYGSATHPFKPTSTNDSQGAVLSLVYDTAGNLSSSTDTTATGGQALSYTYNPPAGTAATCGGKPGQMCTAVDGNNNTTRYTYALNGDLLRITPPAPLGATSFTYDQVGRTATRTDGKNQTNTYTYDAADRPTRTRLSGAAACGSTDITAGNCLTYTYDARGNLTAMADQTGTTTYGYDALSRQTSKTLPGKPAQTMTYDAGNNLTSITDAAGTTTYRYDTADQLTHLAEPGGSCTSAPTVRCTSFGYNANGTRTTTNYPTSTPTVMTVTPDQSGRIKQIRAVTGTTVHSDLSYGYDYTPTAGGAARDGALIGSRTDNTATGTAGRTTAYQHDSLSRLTSAVEKDSAGTTTASWTYAYDKAGNRTSASLSGIPGAAATTFGFSAANMLVSRSGNTSGFAHDANGNQTWAVGAKTRSNGSYNNKDQLTTVTADGTTVPFAYTGAGQDERTSAGGTAFTTSPLGLATSTTSAATTGYIRDADGTLVALRTGGNSFYYLYDGIGSVVGLVNSAGTRVNSYSYDPYGISRAKIEGAANPFEYTGGQFDDITGLYKFGIRYYDPTLGRFTQPDPTGLDDHYTYGYNAPSTFTDPTGACPVCVVAAVAGVRAAAPHVAKKVVATFSSKTLKTRAAAEAAARQTAQRTG